MGEAVTLLEQAVKDQPGRPELYLYLANALIDIEKYSHAIDVLHRGVELAPDRDNLPFSLAVAYEKLGRRHEMIEALKNSRDQTGQRRSAQLPRLLLCRKRREP